MSSNTKQEEPVGEKLICDFCKSTAEATDKECWNCGNTVFVYEG